MEREIDRFLKDYNTLKDLIDWLKEEGCPPIETCLCVDCNECWAKYLMSECYSL